MPYDFANFSSDKAEFRLYHVRRLILHPGRWKACPALPDLLWHQLPFESSHRAVVPVDNGVYAFVVHPDIAMLAEVGYLLYIGKAQDQTLRQRFVNYINEPNKTKARPYVVEMIKNWSEHLYFHFAAVDAADVDAVEQELLKAFVPPKNRQFPVEIGNAVEAAFS